jgi:hypothetical protein
MRRWPASRHFLEGSGPRGGRWGEGWCQAHVHYSSAGKALLSSLTVVSSPRSTPREVLQPCRARLSRTSGILDLAVNHLHHFGALWVEGGGEGVLNAEVAAQLIPCRGCELGPLVGGDSSQHAKTCHPTPLGKHPCTWLPPCS